MKKYYFTLIAFCFLSIVNGQIINFPDANFKARLLLSSPNNTIAQNVFGINFKIDANNDGDIDQSEALLVYNLNISSCFLIDLTGLEFFIKLQTLNCKNNNLISVNLSYFNSLQYLDCSYNQILSLNISSKYFLQYIDCRENLLTSLNLSVLSSLSALICNNNQLASLNLTGLTALVALYCENNQLTNLNISGLNNLQYLICKNNQLTTLNVTGITSLQRLECNNNQIINLNLTGLYGLDQVFCQFNQLANLNLTGTLALGLLWCHNNQLTNLNFTSSINLSDVVCNNNLLTNLNVNGLNRLDRLLCNNNQLTILIIKNGRNLDLNFQNNPTIKYICADENQIQSIENKISSYGYISTCQVNSYCSFNSGGVFYKIQAISKFDADSNGCNVNDLLIPIKKYNVSNGINNAIFISNNTSNYSIPVQSGTHTITPILENPTYFNVSPTNATITFPATASPAIQDFCITANGVHNDLEVNLLPVNVARPGFDASYKVVYKNKGNQTQSGSINLTFNDAVLDFVTANPAAIQVLNNLSWSFIDLKPFETREIAVTLNANSPMEIPALNGNDILPFTANITATNDETPNDNIAILNQTVVNSFDPNDKTCLEGNNIVPAKVGDYVHYMIRFENTGTFAAQNIVVKDMIDLAKFDIASLIPVKGSHDFYTRINGNKVEFIFENINLPFDNTNNDGYVAFKIKTKSTLVLGNTFSNSANIYFDYNFPIVTNTATTTVSNSLAKNDFEFSKYFTIYPNPVRNNLNIVAKNDLAISSLSIYNTLGQLVQVITSPEKTVDVSELKTGNYFVKIITDKGSSGTKFVKE